MSSKNPFKLKQVAIRMVSAPPIKSAEPLCSPEVAILGIGRTTAYKLAKSGAFKTMRIGSVIRISRQSFEEWLAMEELDDENK